MNKIINFVDEKKKEQFVYIVCDKHIAEWVAKGYQAIEIKESQKPCDFCNDQPATVTIKVDKVFQSAEDSDSFPSEILRTWESLNIVYQPSDLPESQAESTSTIELAPITAEPLPLPEEESQPIRARRALDEFRLAVRRGEVICDGVVAFGMTVKKCDNIATWVAVNDLYEYYAFCNKHGQEVKRFS